MDLTAETGDKDFSDEVDLMKKMSSKNRLKSDQDAAELRLEANKSYKIGKYGLALSLYNKCLTLAESDVQKALLYGNRSAVCLGLEFYEECLQNIQLARDHKYPREKMQRLEDREKKCLELMASQEKFDFSRFIKLSYEPNPKVSYLVDGLEVKVDQQNQRGVYANRELKVGDIVYLEEFIQTAPTIEILSKTFIVCTVCSEVKPRVLIPCKTCTLSMFCSEECQKYHEVNECNNFDLTFEGIPTWALQPFSIFNKLLAKVGGSIDELEELWTECQENPKTIFEMDLSNADDPECQKNQLRAFLSLKPEYLLPHISYEGAFKIDSKFTSKTKFIREIFKWIFEIAINEVSEGSVCPKKWFYSTFTPLMKRSCAPNVQTHYTERKLYFYVTRPISAGDEILKLGYGFKHFPIEVRTFINLKAFGRHCTCIACSNPTKYKLLDDLELVPNELLDAAVEKYDNFETKVHTELVGMAHEMSEILQASAADYPHRNYVKGEIILNEIFDFLRDLKGQKRSQ